MECGYIRCAVSEQSYDTLVFVWRCRLTGGRTKDQVQVMTVTMMTIIHASCVSIDGLGILLRGPSGAGKSDLALRLIDDGATLISDDYCEVSVKNDALVATAPQAIAGKIEVRGVGIITLPFTPSVQIGLVVDLTPVEAIPRLPESLSCTIEGVTLTGIQIDALLPSAVARVKLAAHKINESGAIVENTDE